MRTGTGRRRLLQILGLGAAALVLPPGALPPGAPAAAPVSRWTGIALGAPARIDLIGAEPATAGPLIGECLEELARLEAIFSLYHPQSALCRLNREGRLLAPPAELVELLGLARRLADRSEGAFDPTIQPLWLAVARDATREDRRSARRLVGFEKLEVSPQAIVLHRPGMALTLDGIAQGYLTDRIAELLRRRGLGRVLVDLGELRALGPGPAGGPWRIGRADEAEPLMLADGALASSAVFAAASGDPAPRPRILDPRTGEPPSDADRQVTVLAAEAVVADGLSTALAVADEALAPSLLAAFPGARRLPPV